MSTRTTYINTSEYWGDPVEVTVEGYRKLATAFDVSVDICERHDGIYIDGQIVAERVGASVWGCLRYRFKRHGDPQP